MYSWVNEIKGIGHKKRQTDPHTICLVLVPGEGVENNCDSATMF